MSNSTLRERLHKQIDNLPDDIVEQIVDFTFFVMKRRSVAPQYEDWDDKLWHEFALKQFFREEDEVEYTFKDAQEVYDS